MAVYAPMGWVTWALLGAIALFIVLFAAVAWRWHREGRYYRRLYRGDKD